MDREMRVYLREGLDYLLRELKVTTRCERDAARAKLARGPMRATRDPSLKMAQVALRLRRLRERYG